MNRLDMPKVTFEVEDASLDQRSYIMGLVGINTTEWTRIESTIADNLFVVSIPEDQVYVLTDQLDLWHLKYRRVD
jgi:hypothetical protein